MVKLLKIFLHLKNKRFQDKDEEKLRGYFGNTFKKYIEFHHHISKDTYYFIPSRIQYKVISGCLVILGIGKEADLLLSIVEDIMRVNIDGIDYKVQPEAVLTFHRIEVTKEFYSYYFKTPWFALNQSNYRKYRDGTLDLNKQLSNNILEFFKICGVLADKKIEVEGTFKKRKIRVKNTNIIGFIGNFQANVVLPDYISLGKRKSIGLGRIIRN